MIPGAVEYRRASSLDDALETVGRRGTQVIAGGQALIPLLRFRLAQPKMVLDIGRLKKLRGIRRGKNGIEIGAATTYRELLDSKVLRDAFPIVAETTADIADPQIRNIGTIGGGLVHADPASDMPAVMIVLDAQFTLASKRGERTVPARKFFKGPFTTALKKNELLTAILLPPLPKGAGTAYVNFEQAASGYALTGAAAAVAVTRGKVSAAALAITGLAAAAFLVPSAATMIGKAPDGTMFEEVASEAVKGVTANEDIHASAEYRIHLTRVAVRRALALAVERAR